jgi:hypothetical protein
VSAGPVEEGRRAAGSRTSWLAALPVALVGAAVWLSVPHHDQLADGRETVTLPSRDAIDLTWMAGWALWLVLLVWSLLPPRFRGPRRAIVGIAALVLCCGGGVGLVSIKGMDRFTPTATAPDGTRWRARWYWDGGTFVDRVTAESPLRTTGVEVGAFLDDDRSALLVLPVGEPSPREPWTRVQFSPAGMLLVGSDARCSLAFDRATAAVIPPADVSPFVLLRSDEQGSEESLSAVETAIRDARDDRFNEFLAPADDVLLRDLDSPNPWVRDAALRLIRAGGAALYPEATKRL